MLRFCIIAVLLVLMSFSPPAHGQVQTYKFTQTYENNGVESKCYFYVPRSYDPERSYPVLYAWHGAQMPGHEMRHFMMTTIALAADVIVVAPDANNVTKQSQLDFLIDTSLAFILSAYNVDPERIVITGYSWGGRIAYEVGLQHPEIFAGIIGIAPAIIESDLDEAMWDNIDKKRMGTIIGDNDFNYSLVDPLMNKIMDRGGTLLYKVKPDINHWDTYFEGEQFRSDYRECYDYIMGVTSVAAEPAPASITVSHYPSPANASVAFTFEKVPQSEVEVRIRDIAGRTHYEGLASTVSGHGHVVLNTASFPSGMYFAEIRSRTMIVVESFVVTHR